MKKLILFSIILVLLTGCGKSTFSLDKKYYEKSDIIEINIDEFKKLVDNKDSFILFIYESSCITSNNFNDVLQEYVNKENMTIYKLAFSDMKKSELNEKIKYYPSLVIYHDGKLVDFLDAESDKDKEYYKSVDGVSSWISKYIEK